MTFFRSAQDQNLRVEGPPVLGWQMTQFPRRRDSRFSDHPTVQWSFRAQHIRSHNVKTTGSMRMQLALY